MNINIPGISVNSTPRKDGRYQAYIVDNGTKKYIYGRTKNEVISKIKEILKNGLPKKAKPRKIIPTVQEWCEQWFNLYKKPNLKPKSGESLHSCLLMVYKRFGDKKISELKTDELQEFFLSQTAERRRDMAIDALRASLEKAKKQGLIKNNPCDGIEIKRHVRQKRKGLTPEEQSIALHTVKGTILEGIFVLLLTGGFRIGELLALTDEDVDFEKNTVNINKDVIWVNNERIVQTTKTESGVRVVPLPESSMKYIPKTKGLLFPLTYNAVHCAFKRLQEKSGVHVSAHILRHTYATRLEEAGVPPKVKQYLMGHASLDVTQNIYTDTQAHYINKNLPLILSAFDTENP